MTRDEILDYLEYSPSNHLKIGRFNDRAIIIKVDEGEDGKPYALKYQETIDKAHFGPEVSWKTIFTLVMNKDIRIEFEHAEIYTGTSTYGRLDTEVRKIVRLYGKKRKH